MYLFTNINESKHPKRTIVITEAQRRLLTESQESKSQSEAIRLLMDRKGWSKEEANKFVREDLRHDFHTLRDKKAAKFTLGIVRMWCDGDFQDADTIIEMDRALRFVAGEAHINDYTRNLERIERNDKGGEKLVKLSAQQIIETFRPAIAKVDAEEEERMKNTDYSEGDSRYEIIPIKSFEEANKYSSYVSWCVTHNQGYYKQYTGGDGTFYFCLKDGYEDEPKVVGDNCPLDDYGLSMIAVCVDGEGKLKTCTCRWNHDHGGNDNIMSKTQICEVLHVNFNDTFIPLDDVDRGMSEEEYFDRIMEDEVSVLYVDEIGCGAVLSQDREPNIGEYEFDDSDNAIYYLYDEDGSMISDYTYSRNNSIIDGGEIYTILKSRSDTNTVVYYNTETRNIGVCDRVDEYWQNEDKNVILLSHKSRRYGSNNSTKQIYHGGLYKLSIDCEDIKDVHFSSVDGEYYVQFKDDSDSYFIVKAKDAKTIVQFEQPANGEWFDLSDGYAHCANGDVIDLNGKSLKQDETNNFNIMNRAYGSVFIVRDESGHVNMYDKTKHMLLSKDWFDDATPRHGGWFVVTRGGLHNLYNVEKQCYLTNDWGIAADVFFNDTNAGGVFYKDENVPSGKYLKLYTFDGKDIFGNNVKAVNWRMLKKPYIVAITDANTQTDKLYNIETGQEISANLPPIKRIMRTYINTGVTLTEMTDGSWRVFNATTGQFSNEVYDGAESDTVYDALLVTKNGKRGIINLNTGELLFNTMFDEVTTWKNSFTVRLNDKYNFIIHHNGENYHFISNTWFDNIENDGTHSAYVTLNGVNGSLDKQNATIRTHDGRINLANNL